MRNRVKVGLGLVAAAALSACHIDATVDLFGDFQLTGTWTIDGQPGDVTNCTAAGIDKIRLVESTPSGLYFPSTALMTYDCEDGGFATASYTLDYGTYTLRWEALDGNSNIIAMTDVAPFTVSSPTATYALPAFALETQAPGDFNLTGTWTVNGSAADAIICAAADIETVRLVPVSMPSGATIPSLSFDCSAGSFDTAPTLLVYGTYQFRWEALDSSGAIVATQMNPDLVVTNQSTAGVMAFPIEWTPTSLTLNFTYDSTPGSTMTDATCEMVSVHKVYYRLWKQTAEGVYVGGTDIVSLLDTGEGIDCTNSVFFGPPSIALEPGFYSIYAEASILDGSTEDKIWMGQANDLEVSAGTMELYNVVLNQ